MRLFTILVLALFSLAATAQSTLSGKVSSREEAAMEGVLVSAKKGTITVTVVSDDSGRYAFPPKRLAPGKYELRVRAVGYDLVSPKMVTVTNKGTVADLELAKAKDAAAQLSNGEWIASMPGTDRQKDLLLNCVGCHTLERVARSRYDADAFTKSVLPRMQ